MPKNYWRQPVLVYVNVKKGKKKAKVTIGKFNKKGEFVLLKNGRRLKANKVLRARIKKIEPKIKALL